MNPIIEDVPDDATVATADDVDVDDDLNDDVSKPLLMDIEKQATTLPAKPSKKVTIDMNGPKVNRFAVSEPSFTDSGSELNAIKEEEPGFDEDVNEAVMDQSEKQALLADFEKSKSFLRDKGIANEAFRVSTEEVSLVNDSGASSENEMTRTSKTAYEHFVKMQKDLEKLIYSEERYRVRCQELELELDQIKVAKEDDEYKLSEAT